MENIKSFIFKYTPLSFQNLAVSIYNNWQWQQRRSGDYQKWRKFFTTSMGMKSAELQKRQSEILNEFLTYAVNNSTWYSKHRNFANLSDFPILTKDDLVTSLSSIATISEAKGDISYTGGTTGASLKVIYRRDDTQQRFAMLDWFRSLYGWELGKKTAWFSGKTIVSQGEINRGICYRDDWFDKIRFFSTFHINEENFETYWNALNEFKPEFIVGFPSSVVEICRIAKSRNLQIKKPVKGFFPTAETVLQEHREIIFEVLGCGVHDQYASSEGAPFIIECPKGSLHIHPLSGVFEILDENLEPSQHGEMVVTSFTTHGTPLIRYKVGDRLKLADRGKTCSCGWAFPIVEAIEGRTSDFLWSPEFGRVNLGNLSNSTKAVAGITAFQVVQSKADDIEILVAANTLFDSTQQKAFIDALRYRVGRSMKIDLKIVPEIPREASGKLRIVKNNLEAAEMILEVPGS